MSPQEQETLANGYYLAFKKYSDKDIQQAGYKYMEEGEYFPPKPAQIIALISHAATDKHTAALKERFTCASCGEVVSGISERKCFDCAGILPVEGYDEPSIKPDNDFRIEGRRQCQECGNIGLCVQEPRGTGEWLCKRCYTGLTDQEITEKFKSLVGILTKRRTVNEIEIPF